MRNINEQPLSYPCFRLLDMLDEKSMETMKKLGHIYQDRYTGRTKIRVFKKK